jgi:hypothetical protein
VTSPVALNENQIDPLSRAAIREEIADRLRISLRKESERLPANMTMLIERMAADQPAMSCMNPKTEVAQ